MKEELKEKLFAELRKQDDPRMFGKGDVFDNYPYSGKSTDNFYQRYTSGDKISEPCGDKSGEPCGDKIP